MTRFVVCGETLIDLVESSTDVPDSFRSTWEALSAGGPMNSAVALGKLGAKPQFLGRLSRDAFGRQLREHIVAADVGLDPTTSPTKSGPVVQTRETQFHYIVRETGALLYYHLTHGSSDFSDTGLR
jgi:fructokinase